MYYILAVLLQNHSWMTLIKVKGRSRWPSHAIDYLCQIRKESIQNCSYCRAAMAQFYLKVMAELPERYRSWSKIIMWDTPSHASDHMWKNKERIYPEQLYVL